MSIFSFLGGPPKDETSPETETIRKITEALDRLEPDYARYLAGFAYILGRVAHADSHIAPEETREMERILVQQGGLPEQQAIIVVQMAKTQNVLFGSTENYLVTREFTKLASREQKMALLHCLFAVSSVDDAIETVEDNEIRRIAQEIGLAHPDFIAVRAIFRQHLSVLRPTSTPDADT